MTLSSHDIAVHGIRQYEVDHCNFTKVQIQFVIRSKYKVLSHSTQGRKALAYLVIKLVAIMLNSSTSQSFPRLSVYKSQELLQAARHLHRLALFHLVFMLHQGSQTSLLIFCGKSLVLWCEAFSIHCPLKGALSQFGAKFALHATPQFFCWLQFA